MEEDSMDSGHPGSSPPRSSLDGLSSQVVIIKAEGERREGRSSSSPVTLSPRETATSTLLQPRHSPIPVGMLGGQAVYVLPSKQEPTTSPYSSPYTSPAHSQDVEECFIEIQEEPEEKFRFRYKSEMQGTHGCIHGRTYSKKNKTFPTIQIRNVPADVTTVRVRAALYTNEKPANHHVHKVMWKPASETEQDFVESNTDRSQGFRHTWQGLGIIHTSRKNIDDTLYSRISKLFLEKKGAMENQPRPRLTDAEELKLKSEAHHFGKAVTDKLNTVVLGFEAFRVDHGIYRPLCCMTFGNPINNLKNPSTGELKICRISAFAGSVEGEEEVFIFIERVKKGDIHVRFFELDQDEERVWEELAEFQEGDVHHQYAIAFKTPRYRDINIAHDVGVFFELYRPSDGAVSDPKAFRFKPSGKTRLGKRARLTAPLTAMRSRPLPVENGGVEPVVVLSPMDYSSASQEPGLNLNSIIDHLLQDPEYMENLNEPTPYDHIQNLHCNSEIVPDLLVFNHRQGAIATDSSSPVLAAGEEAVSCSSPASLPAAVLDSLSQAMVALSTTEDTAKVQQQLRDTLLEATGAEGNNVLHTAIVSQQIESVKLILNLVERSKAQDILDEPNSSGSPAVHLAVETGQVEVLSLLLAAGASPDRADSDGESAVHAAVRENSEGMLQVLLAAGADPNIPSHFGKFPLHLAVEHNLLPLVRLMAGHSVDMEARDQVAGRTALHLAVDRQLEEMVRFLVKEAKVELSREDYSGMTAVTFAESCRNQNILKIVCKGTRKQNK